MSTHNIGSIDVTEPLLENIIPTCDVFPPIEQIKISKNCRPNTQSNTEETKLQDRQGNSTKTESQQIQTNDGAVYKKHKKNSNDTYLEEFKKLDKDQQLACVEKKQTQQNKVHKAAKTFSNSTPVTISISAATGIIGVVKAFFILPAVIGMILGQVAAVLAITSAAIAMIVFIITKTLQYVSNKNQTKLDAMNQIMKQQETAQQIKTDLEKQKVKDQEINYRFCKIEGKDQKKHNETSVTTQSQLPCLKQRQKNLPKPTDKQKSLFGGINLHQKAKQQNKDPISSSPDASEHKKRLSLQGIEQNEFITASNSSIFY